MRKSFTAALVSLAVVVPGLAVVAPAIAATSAVAADSWIDAPGGSGTYVTAWVNNKEIDVLDGTKFRMTCWWSEPFRGKMFYGTFTSGSHKGDRGDVQSVHVRNQTSVPHCD